MATIHAVNKRDSKVLDLLAELADAGIEGHARIDNTGGGFMPVIVERIGDRLLSVAHYYEQNGDLVPDPEMVFWQSPADDRWYPCSITQWCGRTVALILGEEGPEGFHPGRSRELATFAGQWMRNIRIQQGIGRAA